MKEKKSFKFQVSSFKCKSGFSLLEVLLSVALISILAGISVPVYQSFEERNSLDLASSIAVQSLRRAQVLSQAVDGDSAWGIKAQSGSIVIFRGSSFLSRNPGLDESFDVSPAIAYTGQTEIVFSKFSGLPQATGTITLTSPAAETRNIIINDQGLVSY